MFLNLQSIDCVVILPVAMMRRMMMIMHTEADTLIYIVYKNDED